jgi:hypothetical protein
MLGVIELACAAVAFECPPGTSEGPLGAFAVVNMHVELHMYLLLEGVSRKCVILDTWEWYSTAV